MPDAVLQVGCHESWVEGHKHLPGPAGHNSPGPEHSWLSGFKCILSAHDQLFIHKDALFWSVPSILSFPSLYWSGACTWPCWTSVFTQDHCLNSSRSLCMASTPGAFQPHHSPWWHLCICSGCIWCQWVCINDEGIKEYWSQQELLRDTTCTDLELDIEVLITTLWMQSDNQFFLHWTVHPSNLSPILREGGCALLCQRP